MAGTPSVFSRYSPPVSIETAAPVGTPASAGPHKVLSTTDPETLMASSPKCGPAEAGVPKSAFKSAFLSAFHNARTRTLLLVSLLFATSVVAEYQLHGLTFPVEVELRGERVSAHVTGTHGTVFLAPHEISAYLARTYLSSIEVSGESLLAAAELASEREGEAEFAGRAFGAALRDPATTIEQFRRFFRSIAKLPQSQYSALLQGLVTYAPGELASQPEVATELILGARILPPEEVRRLFSRLVLRTTGPLEIRAFEELERALMARDVSEVEQILATLHILLGEGDALIQRFRRVARRGVLIIQDQGNGNFTSSLEIALGDGGEGTALRALAIEGRHRLAQEALSNGKVSDALDLLSAIPPASRTPTTVQLLIQSLDALVPDERSPLTRSVIVEGLAQIARADPGVAAALERSLQRQARFVVSERRFGEVRFFLDLLARVSNQTSNDAFIRSLARQAAQAGEREFSRTLFFSTATQPGLSERLHFFGSLVRGGGIEAYALMLVVATLVVLYRRRRVPGSLAARILGSEASKGNPAGSSQPPPSQSSGSDIPPEYEELLARFGLPLEADFVAIKSRYRTLIKECHPDAPGGDATRFVEVNDMYERIVELRKGAGLAVE